MLVVSLARLDEGRAVSDQLKETRAEFACFARSLQDNEKGEAQTFLDHFFRALGHEGVIEAGATFEFRVPRSPARRSWSS